MTSYFRILLALLVAVSHINVRVFGYNEGVWAVSIFYILAGHVIQRIFFSFGKIPLTSSLKIYFTDRLLRIFPLYLVIITLTALFLIVTNYGDPHFSPLNVILNAIIVPLNYYMYDQPYIEILRKDHWWLNPPSWSLGAELQAYAILPVLILSPYYVRVAVLITSLAVYSAASLELIHSDYFGYRLLPGVLFFFISGAILERILHGKATFAERFTLLFTYIFLLFWLIYVVCLKGIKGAYTVETTLGFLIGIPLIYVLLKIKERVKVPFSHFASGLSYAIFLVHFPLIWVLDFITGSIPSPLIVVLCSLISSAILTVAVDMPMFKVRKSLINRH